MDIAVTNKIIEIIVEAGMDPATARKIVTSDITDVVDSEIWSAREDGRIDGRYEEQVIYSEY
jgi:hypothetical protein